MAKNMDGQEKEKEKLVSSETQKVHRPISAKELGLHNRYDDCWLAIHDNVYDVTKWAPQHPGGDIILISGGTNATAMFEMYHPRTVSPAILKKYHIGKMEDGAFPTFYSKEKDVFYETIKRKVVARLTEVGAYPWHDSPLLLFKTTCIVTGFLTSLYYMLTTGYFMWAAIMGFCSALIGTNIMHDGCHAATSRRPWLNRIAAWSMEVICASTYVWEARHNTGHHAYTNLVSETGSNERTFESDPDVFSTYPLIRMSPHEPWRWYHKYQWFYSVPLFGFSTMMKVLFSDMICLLKGRVNKLFSLRPRLSDPVKVLRTIFMKIASMGYFCFVPMYLYGPLKGFGLFATAHFVGGFVLANLFIVTHITDSVEFLVNEEPSHNTKKETKASNNPKDIPGLSHSWAALQVRTSVNWATHSTFWTQLSGGLNYQIEHHLFPSISHVYYPIVGPVVKQVCKDFGVPYITHGSFTEAWRHTIKHLHNLGAPPTIK